MSTARFDTAALDRLDPRTPLLIGAGAVVQREEDPSRAAEPLELMARALEAAAADAGSPDWLAKADWIAAPRGFWQYPDPCRALGDRFGATKAQSLVAEVGVLQTTLFAEAVGAIQSGAARVVLVTGAEAKFRALRATITGTDAPETQQPDSLVPDRVLEPHAEIVHPLELQTGLAVPVKQYAMIENALRHAEGQGVAEHRREVGALWAGMSRAAAAYPHAWRREALQPEEIAEASDRNPMLAFPYTKLENSQWNVDQAAGLVFTSLEAAREAGVDEARWIFPRAVAESNSMTTLVAREQLHRSPGFALAGEAALERAGTSAAELGPSELYSCFPSAVRVQQREIGLPLERAVSVVGGMTFGGGPLNNFVLQAAVGVAGALRAEPGKVGMLNAVSGMLTKQGVSLWSTEPPADSEGLCIDVSDAVEARTATLPVDPEYRGDATIASYTVDHPKGMPPVGMALCNTPGGHRAVGLCADASIVEAMQAEEFIGKAVRIGAERALSLR